MEKIQSLIKFILIIVSALTSSLYSVGYAYEWGYLDGFMIEHHIFQKSPQKYLGNAIVVIWLVFEKILKIIFENNLGILITICGVIGFVVFVYSYISRHQKIRSRIYMFSSNLFLGAGKKIRVRIFDSFASAYIFSVIPLLVVLVPFCFFLIIVSPGVVGYLSGMEDSKKFRDDWDTKICDPNGRMTKCTQIFEKNKLIASGKLIEVSESNIAIFDGKTSQIFTLRNRDYKTTLDEKLWSKSK